MKQLIKEFIPPVFFRLTKKKTPPPEKKIIYNAYADALSQCTTDAYEENELVEIIVKKTQRFAKEIATGGGGKYLGNCCLQHAWHHQPNHRKPSGSGQCA